ncbi:PKD domain-containing protein [Chitinophagaceae bacterium MMS25-I14]
MRKQLFSVCAVVWMLCLGLLARGQTPITINGPAVVCKNSTWTYSVPSPTSGLSYVWTLTALGNLSSPYGSTTNVLWTTTGTTTLQVQGKNASGTVIELGTLPVTVQSLPQPYITTDYRVACEHLPDPRKEGQQQQQQLFDDSGCVKVCEGSWVTYTANGQPGSTFQWTISGGTAFPSGNTCLVHWGVPGSGSVSVKETTSPAGCIGTRSICIEIIGKPHSSFGTLPDTTKTHITVCNNETVQFIDRSFTTSASPIVSWYWDFGDGNGFGSSTGVNPSHTYHFDPSGSNTYQVMLVVKNQCNCTDTSWMTIDVKDQDGVQIDCPGVVCEKDKAHYQLRNPISCGSYDWSVSGGTIISPMPYGDNIDVLWDNVDTSGFGYVYFDASSCSLACPGVTTVKVPVIQSNGHISGPTIVCPNSAFLYHLPQWPGTLFTWSVTSSTGVTWNNTDQPNELVIHTNGADVINIHCDYKNTLLGCGGSADLTVKILPPVSVTGPTKICVGSSANDTLTAGYVGNWVLQQPNGGTQTGTGNIFTGSYPIPGTYTLSVSGPFCSPAPLVITAYAPPPPPDSLLGPDTVCAGVTYTFTAKNSQPGTLFHWSVPSANGSFIGASTGSTVSVQFTGAGPYVLQVVRELSASPHCASAPLTKTIYAPNVHPHITGPVVVCPNSYANYSAGYYNGEVYSWRIVSPTYGSVASGDGTPNVSVLWNNTTVTVNALLIVKVRKCTSEYLDTLHVTVQPAPVMSLSVPDSICRDVPLPVTLNIGGTGLTLANIHWDFGDLYSTNTTIAGGPVFSTSVSHPYSSLNNGNVKYTIGVTITNPNGCTSTTVLTDSVVVKPAPVAFVTPVGPLVHCNTGFSDNLTATLQSGYIPTSQLSWYKAPNLLQTTCGIPLPCSTYAATGFGQYYVVAMGQNGCSDTSNIVSEIQNCGPSCTISPSPTVTVNHTQSCGAVTLTGSYSAGGYNDSWTWPSNAQGVNVVPSTGGSTLTCNFNVAGNYTFYYNVTYTSTLGQPCVVSVPHNVLVPLVPDLLWGVTCNSTGYNLTLLDHSTYYPGYTPTYFKFSINGTYTGNNTAISSYNTTVAAGNTYLFTLRVGNAFGDTCTISRTVYLDSLPVASFTMASNGDCEGVPIHFTNTSTGYISQFWDFGDLAQVTVNNPDRVYAYPTLPPFTFTPVLTVKNAQGCQSTTSHILNITQNTLSATVAPLNSTICEGSTVNLVCTPSGGTAPFNYTWYTDTTFLLSSTLNTLNIGTNGYYWVKLKDVHRCVANTTAAKVNVVNVPDAIISGDTLQCQGQAFTLNGYAGPDVVTYKWTVNSNPVGGNTPDLVQSGLAPGTYNYQLTIYVNNPAGGTCSRTSSVFHVTVFTPPARPVISYNAVNCATYQLMLSATSPGPGSFTWSNGMSGNPISVNVGGPYRVWFTDQHGCTSDTAVDVPKDPKGYLWVFPEGCYSVCLPPGGLNIYGPIIPFAYWEWDYNYALFNSGTNSLVTPLNITNPGVYGLTLDNGLCQASSGNMYLSLLPNCGGKYDCSMVKVDLTKINYDADCNIFPEFNFSNSTGANVPYTVTTNMGGIVIPPSGTMAPGGGSFSVQWIPPSSFSGGSVTFTVTFILPDGTRCIREFQTKVQCGGPKIDCSMLSARIARITYDASCHVFITFALGNGTIVPLPYAILPLTGGTMVPGTGTAAPGATSVTSQWIPPAGFGSGTANFAVVFTLPDGTQCTIKLKAVQIKCPTGGPVQRHIQTGEDDIAEGNTLLLAPNPAQQTTEVAYSFGDGSSKHVLEVYDVTGRRLVDQKLPDENRGSYTLHVDGWVSGIYQVVIRSNGAAVATARLSVTH